MPEDTQLSSYEEAKQKQEELRKEMEADRRAFRAGHQERVQQFRQGLDQEPDKVHDEAQGRRNWEIDRAEALKQAAKDRARQELEKQAMKMTGQVAKKAVKSLIVKAAPAILSALSAVAPFVGIFLLVIIIIILVVAGYCQLPEYIRIPLQWLGGIFGVECGE